jgi:hypothetical protein
MSSDATSSGSGLARSYRRNRLWWIVLAISIVAAILAASLVFVFTRSSAPQSIPLEPDPPTPKTVKLSRSGLNDIHRLVRQFVYTAVAHKNLAEAYRLLGPGPVRQAFTMKQWVGGMVTVAPYPVDAKTTIGFKKPEWTYAKSVRLQVQIVTPDKPNQVKLMGTDFFYVEAHKVLGRWLVSDWVPRWTPPIPNASG